MRRVLHGDVVAAACALRAVAPGARPGLIRHMIATAELADRYRLATGKAHPLWGTGSLMSAAMAHPRAREPYLDEPDYAACMIVVYEALIGQDAEPEGGSDVVPPVGAWRPDRRSAR